MTKRKKWLTVAICVAVAILIGLAIGGMRLWQSGHGNETEPVTSVQTPAATTAPASTEATEPEVTDPDPTDPDVTEPDVTVPDTTEPEVTTPEPTDPTTETTEPDTTTPEPTNPEATVQPTEAATKPTDPVPTDPTVAETTKPAATKPAATKPTTTKPAATEATKHVHKYTKKVVKPTCTKKGYTKYTCSCGDSYKDDYVAATGHDYKAKKINPTCQSDGYTKYTCSTCGDTYKDNYVAASEKYHGYVYVYTTEPSLWSEGYDKYLCAICGKEKYENVVDALVTEEEYCRLCAEATVKWINHYRKQQGDTEAKILPGLTLVAEYRANQLTTNFAHDVGDHREALAYYQYGEWHDMSYLGLEGYWSANAKEAIGTGIPSAGDPDSVGEDIALLFLRSSSHWNYVGDSRWCYIGVGIKDGKVCILLTEKNFG